MVDHEGISGRPLSHKLHLLESRVLILEENDLLKLVNEKVSEPDTEEDKSH